MAHKYETREKRILTSHFTELHIPLQILLNYCYCGTIYLQNWKKLTLSNFTNVAFRDILQKNHYPVSKYTYFKPTYTWNSCTVQSASPFQHLGLLWSVMVCCLQALLKLFTFFTLFPSSLYLSWCVIPTLIYICMYMYVYFL